LHSHFLPPLIVAQRTDADVQLKRGWKSIQSLSTKHWSWATGPIFVVAIREGERPENLSV